MAQARPMGRPSSPPIALIGTIALLVIAVIAAVVFWLQQSKANEDAAAAIKDAATATRASQLAEANAKLMAKLVNPDAADNATVQDIENFRNERMAQVPNRLLLTAQGTAPGWFHPANPADNTEKACFDQSLGQLKAAWEAEKIPAKKRALTADEQQIRDWYTERTYGTKLPLLDALEDSVKMRQQYYADSKALEDQAKVLKDGLDKANAAVLDETKKVQDAKDAATLERTNVVKDYEGKLTAKDDLFAAKAKECEAAQHQSGVLEGKIIADAKTYQDNLAAKDGQIKKLNDKLRELGQVGDLVADARRQPQKDPAGFVTQVDASLNMVYLRLLRPSLAKLAMRFEIHSKGKPISDTGEGKATVEIVSMENDSIEAKIVRNTPGDPIVPGDPALNLVIGPRKYRFVVYGLFDLRGDGAYAPNGKSQIEGLISNWGGIVQQDVDVTTNFVVLGEQVQVDPSPPPEGSDAATMANAQRKKDENAKWVQIRDQADHFNIPILTTNVFLHLIGYYNYDHNPGWDKRVRPGDDYLPHRTAD